MTRVSRLDALTNVLIFGCLLFTLSVSTSLAEDAGSSPSVDPRSVQIHIEHAIELPWGKPGFRVEVSGWPPNEILSLHAVGPGGEKIALTPQETPLRSDTDGDMTVDIDYERKGLRQGHWMLLIAGKPGIHIIQTDLPYVEAPTASRPTWKLSFGKQERKK